jgi:hypothetical protein
LCELGWPPREFWQATLADVLAAANYKRDAHSGLDPADVAQLKEMLWTSNI